MRLGTPGFIVHSGVTFYYRRTFGVCRKARVFEFSYLLLCTFLYIFTLNCNASPGFFKRSRVAFTQKSWVKPVYWCTRFSENGVTLRGKKARRREFARILHENFFIEHVCTWHFHVNSTIAEGDKLRGRAKCWTRSSIIVRCALGLPPLWIIRGAFDYCRRE